jgi:hypothetical protein
LPGVTLLNLCLIGQHKANKFGPRLQSAKGRALREGKRLPPENLLLVGCGFAMALDARAAHFVRDRFGAISVNGTGRYQTKVMDDTPVRVMSWHDNEWGFSNRDCDGQADLTRLQ